MKKIICILLLIQGGFLMAQETETVVTINGKKVQVNAVPTTADNGLTMTNGKIQLGGALLKPSVVTTTAANTLTIAGLQTGTSTDNVLVADANGVLKWVTRAQFGGDNLGDHTATKNLEMSNKDVNNISSARIKYELVVYDRVAANLSTYSIYKDNGNFGIYNGLKGGNDLSINETTRKTTINNLAIAKSTDGTAPAAGYVATAADASGNVIWKAPASNSVMGIKTISNNYTVAADDYTVIAAGMTGDITITLPAAASSKGRVLVINQNDVSNAGNELTVKFDVDVIYSSKIKAKELLAPFYSASTGGTLKINLQSDGTNWYVVSSL
ncbi:hypothetical protein [Flavobacterium soyae]|uniref:hypothetical protein n=1 Tax=Flavobacterium soyae TaxID=2903098 RepID=UPI001E55AA50|nr:hypothetical protein [Flavobacterium soyae]MCD9576979.1 hypothetical protein [Flavobacterium soyae]